MKINYIAGETEWIRYRLKGNPETKEIDVVVENKDGTEFINLRNLTVDELVSNIRSFAEEMNSVVDWNGIDYVNKIIES